MKVMMVPHLTQLTGEGGITTIVRKYFEHAPKIGIEFVDPHASTFDVLAVHAGMGREFSSNATVSHLHGLYWTEDTQADPWQFKANRDIVESLRHANQVTVPSEWVAKTLQRDMRIDPHVLPHGIDFAEWEHNEPNQGYVLWNKNRSYDVCSPDAVGELARRFVAHQFHSTFPPRGDYTNVKILGVLPHSDMRRAVQRASVYLSTTKETFGIGTLEALASGVPVLGFRQGGTAQLVKHGLTGYLAEPNNYEDLAQGLTYCLANRDTLGKNAKLLVRAYDWQRVVEQLYNVYELALGAKTVRTAVVVPCYNYGHVLERAVESVMKQARLPDELVIVDNNSTDSTAQVARMLVDRYAEAHTIVRYVNCPDQGVAHARNFGIQLVEDADYICCLDADDEISPDYLQTLVPVLHANPQLGLVYTRMDVIDAEGRRETSRWPGGYDYDAFTKGANQVPTCCLFRRVLWQRLGGYRQRYAPHGAGAEDADFWLRMGSVGFGGQLVDGNARFIYHLGGRVSGDPTYRQVNYLKFHPWTNDARHPFASVAAARNNLSHPVRQYDTPVVSVVIPCTKAHVSLVVDALDSLEGQTLRQWEAILVCDGFEPDDALHQAYPFVKIVACTSRGAGAARNLGASYAVGQYLFFLDADDWAEPQTLERLLAAAKANNAIAYSDYNGHAIIDDQAYLLRLQEERRLIEYDELTHKTVIAHRAYDYDCLLAQRQPELNAQGEFYIWCLISSLVPRQWHVEVGGFDETMESWEDFEYWVKLARKGKCFVRVAERLLNYRFYTGERRELASPATATTRQRARSLLEYLHEKFSGEKPMGCGNCSQPAEVRTTMPAAMMMDLAPRFAVDETVEVQLIDGNFGDHGIKGMATETFYGNKKHGDTFLMSRRDAEMMPRTFRILGVSQPQVEEVEEAPPPLALPVELFDFTTLPGVTTTHAESLANMGVRTLNGLLLADQEELKNIFPSRTLKKLLDEAQKQVA